MKLVDAFPFYNELDVLELRLKLLYDKVDRFVIVESPETHSGVPKPLFFQENKERFSRWSDKIRHVIAPVSTDKTIWGREKFQRDCIMMGLDGVSSDAMVMISDADEIPDLDVVMKQNTSQVTSLHMIMFEYSFDYIFTGEKWIGTVITTLDLLITHRPNFFRDHRWNFPVLEEAGWHLSSFGDADHVWTKIQTYAHSQDLKHRFQTKEDFVKYLDQGVHSDGVTKLLRRPAWIKLPDTSK